MKKCLSVLLVALLIISSVSCAFSAFAEEQPAVWEQFTLGNWPQSKVEDAALLAHLDNLEVNLHSYGFTAGSQKINIQGDMAYARVVDFSYADVEYAGERYRKVVFHENRPSLAGDKAEPNEGTYYFKWEPILWNICAQEDGGFWAISDNVLDQQPFSYDARVSSWRESFLRSWLNEIFYKNAFTPAEQSKIKATERYIVQDAVIIPAAEDRVSGGMLYNCVLNDGFAEGYSVLMRTICDSRFLNQKTAFHSLYMSSMSAVKNPEKTNANITGKVLGVKPLIFIAANTALPGSEPATPAAAHTHVFNRKIVHPAAVAEDSCTEAKKFYYTCAFCDKAGGNGTFSDEMEVTYHKPVQVISDRALVPNSVKSTGWGTYYYTCEDCGELIKKNVRGENYSTFTALVPHEHNFELIEAKEATCTESGFKRYACTLCTHKLTQITQEAFGHNPYKKVCEAALYKPASQGNPAQYYYTCSRCGEVLKTAAGGSQMLVFSYSGEHEHTYRLIDTVAPTCNSAGVQIYACALCGITYSQQSEEALGHSFVLKNAKQATCTKAGEKHFICERCGENTVQPIPALEHSYTAESGVWFEKESCTSARKFYYCCEYCGHLDKNKEHYYTDEEFYGAIGHKPVRVKSEDALAQKGENGEPDVYFFKCSTCAKVLPETWVDGIANHEHQLGIVQVHYYGTNCEKTIVSDYACKYCNYICSETAIKVAPHVFTKRSDKLCKPASCTENAVYYASCKNCGTISTDVNDAIEVLGSATHCHAAALVNDAAVRSRDAQGNALTCYYTCADCKQILPEEKFGYFEVIELQNDAGELLEEKLQEQEPAKVLSITFSKQDVNRDGAVDIADVSLIISYMGVAVQGYSEAYDLNNNGVIDAGDLSTVLLAEGYGKSFS